MKYVKLLPVLLLLLGLGNLSYAQSNKRVDKMFEKARTLYTQHKYPEALEVCDAIIKIDGDHVNTSLLMAEMYKDMDSTRLEILQLTKAQKNSSNPLIDFRLGEAFYKLGMYSEALSFYEKYKEQKAIPEKRQFLLACKMASCKFALQSIENPVEFDPSNMGENVNSPNDEYWPTPTLDGKHLVFTRLTQDHKRSEYDG